MNARLASGELVEFWKSSNRNWSLLLLGILGAVTTVIFSQTTYDLLYWILPPLAVLAFQTELAVVLVGTLLCISIAVPLTVHGTGPLWLVPYASMQARVLALQIFVLAALSVTLPIALMPSPLLVFFLRYPEISRRHLIGLARESGVHRRCAFR